MKAPALRLNLPDTGAVARSLLGVLAVASVAVLWGPAGAAASAAAAGAIAGAIALQDNPLGRIPLVLGVSAELGAAVLLGGVTAAWSAVFVAAVAIWGFLAGMQWAVSAPAGLLATAAGVLVVIQHPQSVLAAVTCAVFAVLAGLLQAALIALWPPQRWRLEREALTKVYLSLSADARSLATEPGAEIDTAQLLECKEAFSNTETPSPGRRPPTYRDWHGLPEQIAATLTAARGRAVGQDAVSGVLIAAADVLAAIGARHRAALRDAEYALTRLDTSVSSVDGPEAAVMQRLSRQLHRAHALRFGRRHASDWSTAVKAAADRAYGHLYLTSPILRHAIRISCAATAGTAVARFADVPQGYWIPLTVFLVMRPETAHTYTRCFGRVAGICAGVAVASAVTLLWQPSGLGAAVAAVAFMAVAYAVSVYGHIAVAAAFAATLVFLLDIAGPPASLSDLVFATLIGGSLAVLAHVVVPDDALIRLRQRAGELLKTEIDYAATVIKAFVHDLDHPADALAAAWQRALRARAAFEAAAGATRVESRELRRWLRSFRAALNSVTSSCTTLEASLPPHPSEALSREFILSVDDYVEVLRGDPPTPAKPWSIDVARLTAAEKQLRDAAADIDTDDGAARVLVAEVETITRSLAGIVESREAAAS